MKKNKMQRWLFSASLFKILRIMKLSLLILCLAVFSVSASKSYSQAAKLSIQKSNSSIENVLEQIEKETEYRFFYTEKLNLDSKVNVDVANSSINDVLDMVLEGTNINYKIVGRQVALYSGKNSITEFLTQQQIAIKGQVNDLSGQPLPGVSIVVKGTTKGTISDFDGKYTLADVPGDATLLFSFVGMKTLEIPVNGLTTINAVMEEDAIGIEEVVAVGYGTMKKSDLTGSVMSVGSEKFEAQPLTKMDQALQGRAAGVQVVQTSGQPGAAMKIRIRGANSISGNNDPLYVVDGMVVGDIGSINVNDIESMEVLKDASATAIYGSRGANGVVLITTKAGKKGKSQIVFDTFHGVSNVFQKLPVMSPVEFAEGVNFADYPVVKYTPEEIDEIREWGGVNWQNELFKTAPSHNYQLSISGGKDKVDYFISGSLYDAEGTIIDQKYRRYTLRSNINAQVTDGMKVGVNISGSREESKGVRADLSDGLTYDPTTPIYDENGNYNFFSEKSVANGEMNPVINPNERTRENFENRLTTTGYFDMKLSNSLVLNVSGGLNLYNQDNNGYTPLVVNARGNGSVDITNNYTLQNTNRLTYKSAIGANQNLQVDVIHEQQYYKTKFLNASATDFFSDATTYKDLSLGLIKVISNGEKASSLQSFLGRVNYSVADKYLITASVRADGSSRLGEGKNRWGYFPSGSVAWRVSEEDFMKNYEDISSLKLRASYGVTGNQAIAIFATRPQSLTGVDYNYPFSGSAASIGVAPSNRMANPDLTWEQTAQFNAGFDLGLWNNSITVSFDAYKKITSDLLLDVTLPEFVGPTVMAQNIGEMENKGFEFVLGWTPKMRKDWSVSNTITFNRNVNKVTALVNDEPIEMGLPYMTNTFAANPTRIEVGLPLGSFRGYIFEGVWQTDEAAEAANWGRKPGDAKYRDVSGPAGEPDGAITADDITTVGDGNPDFTFGVNGNVSWKNLSVDYLFTGSVGNDIYNFQRGRMMSLGASTFHAVHADYKDRWTVDNPSNEIPSGRNGTELLSSAFVEDGSYLALKNVSLSYLFKNVSAFKAIGLESLKVYGSVENAFILTGYRGFDPESTASGGSDVDLGIDINAYPLARAFTMGVKLTF